ncbi:hypothetical protein D3C76_1026880 [compost metagenome]
MACTDKVNIGFLKQTHIFLHQHSGKCSARYRMNVVTIDASKLKQLPVNKHFVSSAFNLTETYFLDNDFNATLFCDYQSRKGIQIRMLTVPFQWICDGIRAGQVNSSVPGKRRKRQFLAVWRSQH